MKEKMTSLQCVGQTASPTWPTYIKAKIKTENEKYQITLKSRFPMLFSKKKKKKVGGGYQGPLEKWLILGLGAENTQANIQKPNVSL